MAQDWRKIQLSLSSANTKDSDGGWLEVNTTITFKCKYQRQWWWRIGGIYNYHFQVQIPKNSDGGGLEVNTTITVKCKYERQWWWRIGGKYNYHFQVQIPKKVMVEGWRKIQLSLWSANTKDSDGGGMEVNTTITFKCKYQRQWQCRIGGKYNYHFQVQIPKTVMAEDWR